MKWVVVSSFVCLVASSAGCNRWCHPQYYGATYAQPVYQQQPTYAAQPVMQNCVPAAAPPVCACQ